MAITKDDLYNNTYNMDILKNNIYGVSLLDILKTQKLTASFCIKYILNPDFQIIDQDQNLTIDHVKQFQPHILHNDLITCQVEAAKKRTKKQRIDSFEDFESYMNRHI
jgi:hypothetical protein